MQVHILRSMVGVSIVSLIFSAIILTDTGKNHPNKSEGSKPNVVHSDENGKQIPNEVKPEKNSQAPVDTPQVRVKNRLDLLEIESETDSSGTEDEIALSARGGIGAEEIQNIEVESSEPFAPESNRIQLADDPLHAALSINFTTEPGALGVPSQGRVDSNEDATPVEYEKEKQTKPEPEGSDPTDKGDRGGGEHKGRPKLAHVNEIPIIKMGAYQQEPNGLTVIKTWNN